MFSPALRALDLLSAQLPFHLNDVDQVNRLFQRWQALGFSAPNRDIDVWTYCFVRRYFLVKFIQETSYTVSDFDALIEDAFHKIEVHRMRLQDPSRYAHWVSVICKNTFLNYLRARRRLYPLHEEQEVLLLAEMPAPSDVGFLAQALLEAIERLPPFLREVARLRLVEECDYGEIAARTGKPAASVRTYFSKAVMKLRKDPRLAAFLDQSLG